MPNRLASGCQRIGVFMHSYRCYPLDTHRRITTVEIVECADDDHAKLRSREICSARQSCHGLEVWDNARRVYCYTDHTAQSTRRTANAKGE